MTENERGDRDTRYGFWLNDGLDGKPCGYRSDVFDYRHNLILADTPLYRFQLETMIPLTYVLGQDPARYMGLPVGTEMQPCKLFYCDAGSVPALWQCRISPRRFTAWWCHDSAYQFRYVWMRLPTSALWTKLPLTRAQADWLFCYYGILAQDGSRWDAFRIFNVVNLFGWAKW